MMQKIADCYGFSPSSVMVQVKPCGYHHVVYSLVGVILITTGLDKQVSLADSLIARALAADLIMQQPARSKGLCPAA
jgi:hypothetical protein